MDETERYWIKSLEKKIDQLERDLKCEQEMVLELREDLEDLKKAKPSEIRTDLKRDRDLLPIVGQFMDSIELLNAEASKRYESGMNPMMISDFSVDLQTKIGEKPREEKNLLGESLGESDKIGVMSDVRPDPDCVHTIRFSLKPTVGIRRID